MNHPVRYPTKAALIAALEAGIPTAVGQAGMVDPWLCGPITIEGPFNRHLAVQEPTWTAEAVVENCFIVPGSVE